MPVQAQKGDRSELQTIRNLNAIKIWVVSTTLRPLYSRYPLYRRLSGARAASEQKMSPPSGIKCPYRPANSVAAVPSTLSRQPSA